MTDIKILEGIQPLSFFSVYHYSTFEISHRVSYLDCIYLIKAHAYCAKNSKGIRYWNIHDILTTANNYTTQQLHLMIDNQKHSKHSILFAQCRLLTYDIHKVSYLKNDYLDITGYIQADALFYYDSYSDSILNCEYELDWPNRYPGIQLIRLMDETPDTLPHKLVTYLNGNAKPNNTQPHIREYSNIIQSVDEKSLIK